MAWLKGVKNTRSFSFDVHKIASRGQDFAQFTEEQLINKTGYDLEGTIIFNLKQTVSFLGKTVTSIPHYYHSLLIYKTETGVGSHRNSD